MNAPDAIAHPDRVEHGRATRAGYATKYCVNAVQVGLRGVRDEVLRASRVGARERHPHGARFVADGIDLVADGETGPAPAVPPRIPVLHHEVRHDAMPAGAVEITPVDEVDERSEEHTSELQSLAYLVCRLLLEKKKKIIKVWCSRYSYVDSSRVRL